MYRILIVISAILGTIVAAEAQNHNDTIATHQLGEVVVMASNRVQRGDTLCVTPSGNQKKFNATGFELLRSMMLPGLRVNAITGELSLNDGSSAIVLINGRLVDRQDILALRPKEIAKVEYIQNPGTEYGYDQTLGAVINVVMKERKDGYAAAVVANNAVTTANGQNFAFGKYTDGNSEYALSFNSDYTSLSKRRIDNNNTYLFDGQSYNMFFKGIDTPLKYTENTLQAGYNHLLPGKQIFDLTFKGVFYHSPDRGYAQKVFEDDTPPYSHLTEPYEKYLSPRLNIYYKRWLTENSTITANIVGNYRNTDYRYAITECQNSDFNSPYYNYEYGTKSHRQAYIGEVKYLNRFNRKFNLNIGSRVLYAYTSNRYTGSNTSTDKQHDTNIYAYAYTYGYFGKIYYMAGIGLSGRIIDQNSRHMTRWTPRPQLQLIYNLHGWKFNLYGTLIQESPSLSEMASTEFRINRFEIKKGNPDLQDWQKYRVTFKINKNFGPANIQNTLSYISSHDPVMTSVYRQPTSDGYQFVTSYDNQRSMSVLTNSLNVECGLSNNLAVTAGFDFKSYQSKGLNYSNDLNNWQFNIAADWFAGNWNAGINWRNRERSLTGESISYTGSNSTIYVNYIIGNQWRIGLIGQYLFSKNGPVFKESLHSKYLIKDETTIVPAQKNMIMVSVAWNFSAGKQRKEAKIDMTNEDNSSSIFR